MTRQIAIAIGLAAFLTMTVAGLLTYWTARETILNELDQNLITRAVASLPRGDGAGAPLPTGDRFVVENAQGQTLARSHDESAKPAPRVISRTFTGPALERFRTIVLTFDDPQHPARIVYSTPAGAFERLQERLAWTIAMSVIVGGALTAMTAVVISRRVTRPLHHTAEVIGTVDDANLDRRIDPAAVPVELVPMVTRLNQMLARLEEAFRRQSRFLADAAHELRTPVAAMRAGLEIALSRPRTAEHLTEVLRRTARDAIGFGKTVEAMLEAVRSGSEQRMDPADFDLAALLRECVEQVEPLATERGLALKVEVPDALRIRSEAAAVRTIVWNFLSNAVAHTPAGGSIFVAARERDDGVEIEVRDTGEGIAEEHLERIFDPFYRVDPSRSHAEHLGLGLYLVRRHVQHLAGTIGVKSLPGEETAFRVWLPRGQANVSARRLAEPATAEPRVPAASASTG